MICIIWNNMVRSDAFCRQHLSAFSGSLRSRQPAEHSPVDLPDLRRIVVTYGSKNLVPKRVHSVSWLMDGCSSKHGLVGGWPTLLKHMKFSWDDEIPNVWKVRIHSCSKPPTSGNNRLWMVLTHLHDWVWWISFPAHFRQTLVWFRVEGLPQNNKN